jgi:hypothetical protein
MWTHKKIKELEETDYFDYYFSWEYENESYFDYDYDYYGDYISYERLENGLVDWSQEIPVAVKRQHKIDQILGNIEDCSNNIAIFWP